MKRLDQTLKGMTIENNKKISIRHKIENSVELVATCALTNWMNKKVKSVLYYWPLWIFLNEKM